MTACWGIRVAQKYWPTDPTTRPDCRSAVSQKRHACFSKTEAACGGSVVILPRFEPKAFLTALANTPPHGGVPAMYRMVLAEEELLSRLEFLLKASRWIGRRGCRFDCSSRERRFRNRGLRPDGRWWPLPRANGWWSSPLGSCGLVARS